VIHCFPNFFHEERGDFDIIIKEWSISPEYGFIRELQYKSPSGNSNSPPSRIEETQRYKLTNTQLTIESFIITFDVIDGDCFRIETKMEVIQNQSNSCSANVNFGISFFKKTKLKSVIETNAEKDTKKYFQEFCELAQKELLKKN